MNRWQRMLTAGLLLLAGFPAWAAAPAASGDLAVSSPDASLKVVFALEDSRPHWELTCDGAPILSRGPLGVELDSGPLGPFTLLGADRTRGDATWRPVWGNRSEVRDRYQELTLKLQESAGMQRRLDIILRAYDEGVAVRYVLPRQPGLERATIKKRLTEYRFGESRPIYQNRNYEYGTVTIDTMSRSEGVVTVDAGGGRFVALTDADRTNSPQLFYSRKAGSPGTIVGVPLSPATGPLPFATSWEAVIVGRTAGKLYENRHLVENLNPPCAVADTSWIRPGEAICQVRNTRMVTTELKKLMDFASAHRIEYVEIDHSWCGAETKWTPAEIEVFVQNKSKFWDDKPEWKNNVAGNPMVAAKGWVPFRPKADSGGNFVDLDVAELAAYGNRLNPRVGVCLYLRGAVLKEFGGEHPIAAVLATYQRWGVAGIKAGFVPCGSQAHEQTIAYLVRTAAEHKLIVNIHDAYYPSGLSRTYPNLMNVEGVAGEEAEPFIDPAIKSRHDVMVPFTRCLMGPVDYTPEIYKTSKTQAHQVAMLGVYHGRPSIRGGMRQWSPGGVGGAEIEFLENLPGLFDEMKVVADLGKSVTVARRRGNAWFVASMADGQARTYNLPLDFLRPGVSYRASIHADVPGKLVTAPSRQTVTSTSVIPIAMEPNGGHLMILEPADLDFSAMLQPIPATAKFSDPDYYIWCGTMLRGDDGKCHLYYSRWPRSLGHNAWVTHSEIAHAVGNSPAGPFRHRDVALPARGKEFWDGLCTHNPNVHRFGGRYYLYYMGNTGDGVAMKTLNWTHRNNQRIGVAVADSPDGPWQRLDQPLIAPTPGFIDALCCNNPTVTQRPDGGYLMIYKAVGDKNKLPFGGPVLHAVATSAGPTGPFRKHPQPVFVKEGVAFAAEDPFIWTAGDHYYAIVKDNAGHFTGQGKSTALFESADGLDWKLAKHALVATTEITWEGGRKQKLHSLERPQLYFENGRPAALLFAADEDAKRTHSFNVQIPLKQ